MAAVTIPVMAKARIGHFAEAQILEALGVDMVDESEGESGRTGSKTRLQGWNWGLGARRKQGLRRLGPC